MTLLRSREILSSPKSKPSPSPSRASPPKTAVSEPVTPPLTSQLSEATASPISTLIQNIGTGSIIVSESGSLRRHSARLAKKVDSNAELLSGNRKEVEGTSFSGVNTSSLKRKGSDLELEVESSDWNPDANVGLEVSQDLGDGGGVELVKDCKEIECSDVDSSAMEIKDNDRRKRRLSMEVKSLQNESSENNKVEQGFLSLRSGKRVVKREINDDDIGIAGDSFQVKMEVEGGTSLFSSKRKMDAGASSSCGINLVNHTVENADGSGSSGVDNSASDEVLMDGVQAIGTNLRVDDARNTHRERFRNFARRNASRFAHFSSRDELGGRAQNIAETEPARSGTSNGIEDWPGPFSTAMKIIRDRESRNGERHGASTKCEAVELKWIPKSHESFRHQKHVPSLQDKCLSILSANADAITSLDFVPDALRHKISWFLCDSRRMDGHFLELLVHGTPTEIRIRDCSWLTEEEFTKIFKDCNTSKLTVLQFDQGGCCMPDYTLYSALARSPNSLPALTAISLKGAYRLSDSGLSMLSSAAPSLKSIDISQCPLLTSEGICCLATSLRLALRELYMDNCHGIDAMLILPSLEKLENLEVLSVAGMPTVCDDFVSYFVTVHGCRMKELILADCMELSDSSLKVIGDTCSDLRAIDLSNLCKLTDVSIGHLANGCQAIQTLKLCRNLFSDEAIAAYLDVSGAPLKSLSLNNIIQVSNHTALSLARNCKKLQSLDLSWCRNLTNDALGLIVDSCFLLEVLKLFGCTQVTNAFLDGHSNPQVKLIGLKMTPVFKHIDVPDFLAGPLRYPSACP